jgi:hypothetical protein
MISKVLDRDKLKRLIHYAAYRCVDNPRMLGAIKLNKVLWYSDLAAYLTWGAPITGGKYIKKQFGPVSSGLMSAVEDLEEEKAVAVRRFDDGIDAKVEYLALTTPDASIFKPEEIRVIEDSIQMVCHRHSARSISRKSHDIVWELAELDEEIPYHAILGGRLHEIESDDVAWAREELKTTEV